MDWEHDADAPNAPSERRAHLPRSREELEALFSGGNDPGLTRTELDHLAREFLGLPSFGRWVRKPELVEYCQNPDLRPAILDRARQRARSAQERVAARRDEVAEGLRRRPGRWRFGALSRLSAGNHIDAITGRKFNKGIIVRDLRSRECLPISDTTATEMRRRKSLPWFDIGRLPVVDDTAAAERAFDHMISEILEAVPSTIVPPDRTVSAVDASLDEFFNDGR